MAYCATVTYPGLGDTPPAILFIIFPEKNSYSYEEAIKYKNSYNTYNNGPVVLKAAIINSFTFVMNNVGCSYDKLSPDIAVPLSVK